MVTIPAKEVIWAERALLPGGWAEAVKIEVTAGRIASVTPDAAPEGARAGLVIPAPANLHSHAFQRAMAGLTERRGPDPSDSFWTWRRLMYRFLDQLTPDQVEAIAAFVQLEMLEAGYATNVEFHYLHHGPGGQPYDNLAELSARISAAAETSGIGLTLLPVLYEVGGCDGRALVTGQDRFGNDADRFIRLMEGAGDTISALPDARLGVAPHSLRAVTDAGLSAAIAAAPGPIHMHLAEQVAEVEEVTAHHGARPVEHLLATRDVTRDWCLIHCTQMTPEETAALAATGAVAGLCPITESSLGDGIFDGANFLAAGGRIGIGSDSNIRISLSEELRTLEYSQRLRDRARAVLATQQKSTARHLLDQITAGGAQAAGRETGAIQPGLWADLTALDMGDVNLTNRPGDTALDAFVFAGDDRLVTDVWAAGRHMVRGGRHIARDQIEAAYRATIAQLEDAM